MANIRDIVNDVKAAASSNLQFVGTVPSGFRYREILSGAEFDSPSIIDGAKGNPPDDSTNPEKNGATLLGQLGAEKDGLYGGKTTQQLPLLPLSLHHHRHRL